MSKLSFTERLNMEKNDSVMLYRGRNGAGQDFFAYIVCQRGGVEKMHKDYENGATVEDISEYGEVVYLDYLVDPDEKAIAFLKEFVAENGGTVNES